MILHCKWNLLLALLTNHMALTLDTDWQLVWQDEFDEPRSTIDNKSWNYELGECCDCETGCGWGNNEKQSYTNNDDNIFVSNGHLIIQAIKEDGSPPYTSGRLVSKKNWRYGKIQAKVKFPTHTRGLMASIWLLPTYEKYGIWPGSGEIDLAVMADASENGREFNTNYIYGTIYPDFEFVNKFTSAKTEKPGYSENYYVYELLWEMDKIQWFVNDTKIIEVTPDTLISDYIYPFNERFHLVISLAVGGHIAGDYEKTSFPQRLEIDYIKVYQML